MFSKEAKENDEIFTADLTLCSKCQIDGEDFVNFCGLLRKHELYENENVSFLTHFHEGFTPQFHKQLSKNVIFDVVIQHRYSFF